jgi:hypothetical protein
MPNQYGQRAGLVTSWQPMTTKTVADWSVLERGFAEDAGRTLGAG